MYAPTKLLDFSKSNEFPLNTSPKNLPGTAEKNLTASLCPWKLSCACAMVQKGINVPGVTLSPLLSLYTRMTPPGRPAVEVVMACLLSTERKIQLEQLDEIRRQQM